MTSRSCPQIHRPVALKAFIRHLTTGIRRWFAFRGLVHTACVVVYRVDTIMTIKCLKGTQAIIAWLVLFSVLQTHSSSVTLQREC